MSRFYDDYQQPEPDARFNSAIKTLIIQIVATAIITLYVVLCCTYARAAITGPESLTAGEMGVYRLDGEAVVNVFPVKYQSGLYVDSAGTAFAFASSEPGQVTFVASSVKEGKPYVEFIVVSNGDGGIDDNDPFPPAPDTLAGAVKAEVGKITGDNKQAEVNALQRSFSAVVATIDAGRITTPQQARETFRLTWKQYAIAVSPTTERNWTAALTAISGKINNESVKTIRNDYAAIAAILKEDE